VPAGTNPVGQAEALYGLAMTWARRPGENPGKALALYRRAIAIAPRSAAAAWSLFAMARLQDVAPRSQMGRISQSVFSALKQLRQPAQPVQRQHDAGGVSKLFRNVPLVAPRLRPRLPQPPTLTAVRPRFLLRVQMARRAFALTTPPPAAPRVPGSQRFPPRRWATKRRTGWRRRHHRHDHA